jgi:NADH-quinone oxidoreductase subunit C/D
MGNGNGGDILADLGQRFGAAAAVAQPTADGITTFWADAAKVGEILRHLKSGAGGAFRTLFDLTAIDERERRHRDGQPAGDFTVVYHLLSYRHNRDVRVKVSLVGDRPSIRTVTGLWRAAAWYEREAYDMFGIGFDGHGNLRRILMPPWWQGHPLRKEHPARATEMGRFELDDARAAAMDEAMRFRPEEWGMDGGDSQKFMYLNLGPHHPGTHGLLRIGLKLAGENIVDAACDIGFHHRGAEKMGERQTWHTYIPYTDRVDYLGGVMNNFPYVLAVEKLAGIEVPDRAKVIRIMMAEMFRVISHLVFYGTFAQDVGAMSPAFYMFNDRERALGFVEAVTGARMHPGWFRIGGVAQDLPEGWQAPLKDFLDYMPKRLAEYDRMVLRNRIFRLRTEGVGQIRVDDAIEWGATGPMLRSTGMEWDFRRNRPYGGYEQFAFDIPVGRRGDCYDRAIVHAEEIRQSLRILRQCLDNMPAGPYKAAHPLTTPPPRERTMRDIETLIHHFLTVTWGPVIPPGEACVTVEAAKGNNGYYLISDGGTGSYRTRIRTPSFAHIQMLPMMTRGGMIPDLVAVLASLDYVLADVDR